MLWRRKSYVVTLWLDGRNPRLRSAALDFPSRYSKLTVKARSFNHAARVALAAQVITGDFYSARVRTITRL